VPPSLMIFANCSELLLPSRRHTGGRLASAVGDVLDAVQAISHESDLKNCFCWAAELVLKRAPPSAIKKSVPT